MPAPWWPCPQSGRAYLRGSTARLPPSTNHSKLTHFLRYDGNVHFKIDFLFVNREIPNKKTLILSIKTDACVGRETEINYLEHVQAVITLNATRRGDVTIYLHSPQGTRYRPHLHFKTAKLTSSTWVRCDHVLRKKQP